MRLLIITILLATLLNAQHSTGVSTSPLLNSLPSGQATADVLDLTIQDAITRALQYNLAVTEVGENARIERAQRLRAFSSLLPNLSTRTYAAEQQVNLAAFGFSGFPGIPSVVGPFSIFDTRTYLTQPVLNLRNLRNYRASQQESSAAELNIRDTREQIVVAVTGLYLQAIAANARVESQRAQVSTAETAFRLASDRKAAGTVPGIDVLRSQVQFQSEQQRLIYYEGESEKQKLTLARAIGLPLGQQFRLADDVPYSPLSADITIDATLTRAYSQRADYRAAETMVKAAELAKSAARAGRLPSAGIDASYGVIGQTLNAMHGSFNVTAFIDIPIFQGGRVQADVDQADALLARRKAELESLRGRIDSEVRIAFTDVRSSARQVQVATDNVKLAKQQVEQSQDRFSAGVTNNLEVVQAQQALALANENYIQALYAFNAAKAMLVRARGDAEQSITEYIRRIK